MKDIERDAMAYSGAVTFLRELRRFRRNLPRHLVETLKGQALAGDIAGAECGLKSALKKEWKL